MFSNSEIEQYYDLSQTHYKRVWNLEQSRSLHYGYWDADTKNFHQALININKILSGKAGINKSNTVLDAGCGIGGSSLWLAKNIGCNVTGISLSAKQVATANGLAAKDGLQEIAIFEQKDFTATQYPDESFDIVWAIESVCHAADKSKFIAEAYRLLKKSGKLIMADFFKQKDLAGDDAKLITDWANGWAIDDFETIENFNRFLVEEGFENIQIDDATKHIVPSAKRLYVAYIDVAYLQYKALKKGLWKYHILLAQK